jgi:hypothetical protein
VWKDLREHNRSHPAAVNEVEDTNFVLEVEHPDLVAVGFWAMPDEVVAGRQDLLTFLLVEEAVAVVLDTDEEAKAD